MIENLKDLKGSSTIKQFELDLTLAFWFAIHLEDLKAANELLEQEFLLKQLVACALLTKKGGE